jgi:peptidoglycan hydrolase-like protein with peptidoglycan-binding domain
MPEVSRVATPLAEDSAVKAISIQVLPSIGVVTQEAGRLILAQMWLETGRGKSLFNNNVGNITAGASWLGDFWRPPWFNKASIDAMAEGEQKTRLLALHQAMLEGKAPQKFRAYNSMLDGLRDYTARLNREFHAIVDAAKTGSPEAYADAIRSSGYNKDADPSTAASLRSLMNEFEHKGYFASLPKAQAPAASSSQDSSSPSPEPSSSEPSVPSVIVPGSGELPTLTLGCVGSAVDLFRFLAIGGTGALNDDDIAVIKGYQTTHGLKRDGIVGPITWAQVLDSHNLRKL